MKAGRIARTGKNLQKLGEAWMRAKETDEALRELQAAAQEQQRACCSCVSPSCTPTRRTGPR